MEKSNAIAIGGYKPQAYYDVLNWPFAAWHEKSARQGGLIPAVTARMFLSNAPRPGYRAAQDEEAI